MSVPDHEHGGQKTERLRVVDWATPENNDFLLVSQFSVTGALYTCRPHQVDQRLAVGSDWNSKKPGVPARAAFDENLNYLQAADTQPVLVQRADDDCFQRHGQPFGLTH